MLMEAISDVCMSLSNTQESDYAGLLGSLEHGTQLTRLTTVNSADPDGFVEGGEGESRPRGAGSKQQQAAWAGWMGEARHVEGGIPCSGELS